MSKRTVKGYVRLLTWGCVVLAAAPLLACSVPVFRYALERWPSDPYDAIVFYRGELTSEQQATVDKLSKEGMAGKSFANVNLNLVDLDAEDADPALKQLWEFQETETLPWVTLLYPKKARVPADPKSGIPYGVWSGPLDTFSVEKLIDSPARREVARRLLKGDSGVWVFVDSGQKEKDDAAFKLLNEQLKIQQNKLKLPEISKEDIAQGLVLIDPLELKLKFSTLRLSRDNSAEEMFLEMLLGTEEGLTEEEKTLKQTNEPMVFPIFGRGRALYSIIGAGISEDVIARAGADLTGPCTCTVKDQNPGIDMLMAINWDKLVEPYTEIDKELPPLMGLAAFTVEDNPKDQESDNSSEATSEESEVAQTESKSPAPIATVTTSPKNLGSSLFQNILLAAAVLVGIVIVGSLMLVSKKG